MFKCGDKLPFKPCENPTANPIKIKFVPGAGLEDIKKKNVGNFHFDTGKLAEMHEKFEYGWSKPPGMSQIDDLSNESDKKVIIQGTAAEMQEGMDWFIKVPNGKYDVKVTLKLVENKANLQKFKDKVPMDFMINETEVTTAPMSIKDEIIHDKPNQNVKNGEIRLKWLKGIVSIVEVDIMPVQEAADPGAVRITVAPNTFKGGDCLKNNTKNCIFDESKLSSVKCEGIMVKIGANASNKQLACM